jgi:hypothetical protein
VSLLFRRYGLRGSLDRLEWFWAYKEGPCMILGPIALFWATCKNYLFLAIWALGPRFKFWAHIIDPWDILSLLGLFWDDLAQIFVFSKLSSKACMSILIVDSNSLRKIESNEYNIMDMRGFLFLVVDTWWWSPSHSKHFWIVWVNFDKLKIFGTGWLFLETSTFSNGQHL